MYLRKSGDRIELQGLPFCVLVKLLGVAEAVAGSGFTVHRLAVREIARSGKPEELLERFGISAAHIVTAVREVTIGVR